MRPRLLLLAVLLLIPAAVAQEAEWPMGVRCEGGRIVELIVPVPPGAPEGLVMRLKIAPDICKQKPGRGASQTV